MSEYTPTTDEVRERFVDGFPMDTWAVARDECALDFDRWLAERDRQVAERAWDAAVEETHALGWLHDFAKSDALARNPHRAAKGEQK